MAAAPHRPDARPADPEPDRGLLPALRERVVKLQNAVERLFGAAVAHLERGRSTIGPGGALEDAYAIMTKEPAVPPLDLLIRFET